MSRSFLPDSILTDRLMVDDTEAFEELYRRHWHSLYNYSFQKLHSSDNARRIVRDIFVNLWQMRKKLPVDFTLSEYLYTEVRKLVIVHMNNQLNVNGEAAPAEWHREFSVDALKQARTPVRQPLVRSRPKPGMHHEHPRLFVTLSHLKWLFQTVTAKLL